MMQLSEISTQMIIKRTNKLKKVETPLDCYLLVAESPEKMLVRMSVRRLMLVVGGNGNVK